MLSTLFLTCSTAVNALGLASSMCPQSKGLSLALVGEQYDCSTPVQLRPVQVQSY